MTEDRGTSSGVHRTSQPTPQVFCPRADEAFLQALAGRHVEAVMAAAAYAPLPAAARVATTPAMARLPAGDYSATSIMPLPLVGRRTPPVAQPPPADVQKPAAARDVQTSTAAQPSSTPPADAVGADVQVERLLDAVSLMQAARAATRAGRRDIVGAAAADHSARGMLWGQRQSEWTPRQIALQVAIVAATAAACAIVYGVFT